MASYKIGQLHQNKGTSDDMEKISNGQVKIYKTQSSGSGNLNFDETCLQVTKLEKGISYYIHVKIKRLTSPQIFDIRLINYNGGSGTEQGLEQHIKNVLIPYVPENIETPQYTDIDFIFTPFVDFDTILFKMQRDANYDILSGARTSVIGFIELSSINNKIEKSELSGGKSLVKLGIQSHPGFLFCLNNEEFRLPRTGIFELRDGIIPINFFSPVAGAVEQDPSIIEAQMDNPDSVSASFLGTEKNRYVDSYTIDFMFDNDNNIGG